MKLTILVVNDFAHVNGGAARVAISGAVALTARGHRVIFFAAVPPVDNELRTSGAEVAITGQQEISRDPNRLRAVIQGLWNTTARKEIRRILRGCDPATTVVHLHTWTMGLSSSVVRECVLRGFRVVLTLHDYFVACPNGGFFNYPKREICHLRPLSAKCVIENCDPRNFAQKQYRVARQLIQRHVGLLPRGIRAFVTVSEFSRAILKPHLPPDALTFAIENPTDLPRGPPGLIEEDAPFVFAGRLQAHKGGALLAAAAREMPHPLLYIGDGPLRSVIERIAPNAKMLGWVDHAEVQRLIKGGRALVFPSLWYETQGLVVAEAAAMGIPAIVADTSAARDLVEHGRTGLWFTGGDERSLTSCLRTLCDLDVARKMGAAAYKRFWDRCQTRERHAEDLENCYESVLQSQ
jgi:glycosyltransferase involved in cell wall biosynthesis